MFMSICQKCKIIHIYIHMYVYWCWYRLLLTQYRFISCGLSVSIYVFFLFKYIYIYLKCHCLIIYISTFWNIVLFIQSKILSTYSYFIFFSFVFGGDGFLPDPPGQKHKVDGLCKCPKSDNINVIEHIIHQYPHYRQKRTQFQNASK